MNALYTVTTGRSGTVFLAELLKANLGNAVVYHERTGYPHFGVNTPDASHATSFNVTGNTPEIEAFWSQKLARDAGAVEEWFVEISHMLAKAGLVENLEVLKGIRRVSLVTLRRDPFKIIWSFLNCFNFANPGFTWLFTLDSRYPNRIVDSTAFLAHGMFGSAIWYANEVFARQAYYARLCDSMDWVRVIPATLENLIQPAGAAKFLSELTGNPVAEDDIVLPPRQNATRLEHFGDKVKTDMKTLFEKLWIDPDVAGQEFFDSGKKLGFPSHVKRSDWK